MNDRITADDIRALYAWFEATGAGLGIGPEPCDWFETGARQQEARGGSGPAGAQRTVPNGGAGVPAGGARPSSDHQQQRQASAGVKTAPAQEIAMQAREDAKTAASLDALLAQLQAFEGCGLKATARSLCFYRGAAQARLMVIGEAPGRDEDIQGKPFVGRAGKLLDKMLAAIDLGEADAHITNIVYWRPPGNRNPTPQEAQVCLPFLERQIELVAPEVVLVLGRPAANNLLRNNESIMKMRGKWRQYDAGGRTVRVMPTLHPAYLLRTPAAKRQAWQDLLAVRAALAVG